MEVQQRLGDRYTLLSELGTGGMSVVWRARDEVLGRQVAVKVLAGRFADDPQSRARIHQEARAAATLSHPNIAQVYDFGESEHDDGAALPYVVMELINGPTLQQRVSGGPLPPRTVFRICGEVASALSAAHADGLVHRDIKMANIMVTPAGAKVVDFGIAAAVGRASPEEMLVGTPAYLAPERLTGDAIQPASDVYALGVLLYRLIADVSPWSVETTTQMLSAHIYVEPAPLPDLPGVPPEVADLVGACLSKDPADRPTASQVSATLGDAAEAVSLVSVREKPTPRPANAHAEAFAFDEPTDYSTRDARPAAKPWPVQNAEKSGPAAEPWPEQCGESADRPAAAPRPEQSVQKAAPWPEQSVQNAGPAVAPRPEQSAEFAAHPNVEKRESWATTGTRVQATIPRPRGHVRQNLVRTNKRKVLLAAAGIATLLAAVLLLWGFTGQDGKSNPIGQAAAPPPAVVSPSATAKAPLTATGGRSLTVPAADPAKPRATAKAEPQPSPSVAPSSPSASRSPSASPSPSTDPSPTAAGSRITSPGGSVYAVCDQGEATLSSWSPADGYSVEGVNAGPALSTQIIFQSLLARDRVTVTCVAGTPTPVVLPL